MKFYKEITADWAVPTPNHTYLLSTDKSKMYGYIKSGTEEVTVFKKPIGFDRRRRTFHEVKELGEINLDQAKSESWEFVGSKGDTYIVQQTESNMLKCSCPGFTYRGDCKHVNEVKDKLTKE